VVYTAHTPLATLLSCELALQRHLTHVSTHARTHALTHAHCQVFTTKADVWSAMLIVWESWAQKSWIESVKDSKVVQAVVSGELPDFSVMPPFLAAVVRYGLLQVRRFGCLTSLLCSCFLPPIDSLATACSRYVGLVSSWSHLNSTPTRTLFACSLSLFAHSDLLQVRRTAQTPLALVVRCLHAHSLCARCSLHHQLTCILLSVAPLNSISSSSPSLHSTHSFIQSLYEYEVPLYIFIH
jgi:hypothetical protein